METDYSLFEIGKEKNLPIWDIVRYSVYVKHYYTLEDRERLSIPLKRSTWDYFFLLQNIILSFFKIIFSNGSNVILTASRYVNAKSEYFDKSALPIIEILDKNILILEPILGKKVAYPYIYDFSALLSRILKSKNNFPIEYFNHINKAIIESLGESRIDYNELNEHYHNFQVSYRFYRFFFSFKNTKCLFIATGNPKAQILAARELKITTYLIQHAGIEFDEIDFSFPTNISSKSNILFADYLFTLGEYWCKNINVPTKEIIPIGNDFFYSQPRVGNDNSILIISTIVHGNELKFLTKQLSIIRDDLQFIYKLHPNEFHYFETYVDFFKDNKNVSVVSTQVDTNLLIAKSQLVILIVSAVIYEALNQGKKVAVFKKINYKRQYYLSSFPNIYFFDEPKEIFTILNNPLEKSAVNFYKPTDYKMIKKILY